MLWLMKIFGAVGGSSLTLPILGFIALIGWHQHAKARDEAVRVAAVNVCNAKWESEIRRQERDAAQAETDAARNLLGAERNISERLSHALNQLTLENQKLAAASTGRDGRCLSDGVLNALGDGAGGQADRSSGGAGAKRGQKP